ncbi:ankyrin repeat domain-containing protein [Candidatus Berkiella aquae]|uniref:Ankyrin repeat domain-containing protein n=1 Tax=Candidatus Berkiella aquae TaxID=295108 RepID=A0A0Q9YJE4_9GAMM|nr:ankyrin repeat domain-containing protein [Candidatus Berkiella aquae]MCS5710647.1 ankyrin repeat domain-containing protein [Candidatus Berkiella aquae]
MTSGVGASTNSYVKIQTDIEKTDVDIFIENIIKAAKQHNHPEMKALILNGPNINILDNKKLSAAMYLVLEGDFAACQFLEKYNVNLEDFVCGAAITGNLETYYHYRSKLEEKGITQNYNRIAAYAAFGGHLESVLSFLNSPYNPKPSFYKAANYAALNNQYDVALTLYNHPNNVFKDPAELIGHFVFGWHEESAVKILKNPSALGLPENYNYHKKISHYAAEGRNLRLLFDLLDNPSIIECNILSSLSAKGGHSALTFMLLKHPNNLLPEYNLAASYAASNGHLRLASTLLADPMNTHPNFNKVASFAAKGNHHVGAMALLTDPKNLEPDFNMAATSAASEGHTALTMALLLDSRNTQPDFNKAASAAAFNGHQGLTLALLTAPRNNNPDYERVKLSAVQSGQHQIIQSIIQLTAEPIMVSAMPPLLTFGWNHVQQNDLERRVSTYSGQFAKRQRL